MPKPTTIKRGKTWSYRFDAGIIDGKRSRPSKGGFRTKAEAEAAGTKAMAEFFGTGILFSPSNVNFGDFIKHWCEECKDTIWKPKTYLTRTGLIKNNILPALGTYRLSALTSLLLQDFINTLVKQGYSRNTIEAIKNTLNGCTSYATTHRLISINPMYGVRIPSARVVGEAKKRCNTEHIYLEPQEVNDILNVFPRFHPKNIALLIGSHTGVRIGEASGLRWENFDFENKKMTIDYQLQYNSTDGMFVLTNPKYNSVRTIDIDDALIEELKEYKSRQESYEKIYGEYYARYSVDEDNVVTRTKSPTNEVNFVLRYENGEVLTPSILGGMAMTIHRRTKSLRYNFHSLRVTHATELLAAHVPPKYVQLRLGHKDITVTLQIYQKINKQMESEGILGLEKLFVSQQAVSNP